VITSAEIHASDRAGRALVGTIAPTGDAWRATLTADGAVVYDKQFPTEARARTALQGSVTARSMAAGRRRRPKVRVARRRDRPGTWWLFYRSPDGRRIVARAGTDEKAARTLGRAVEAKLLEVVNGVTPAPSLDAPLLGAYATEVIERRWAERVKPATIEVYRGILKGHLVPRFGARRVDALTKQDLKAFAYDLLRAGKAPATVRRIFAVLSIVLTEAEEDELLARHPLRTLKLGKLLAGAVVARTAEAGAPEEIDALAARCLTTDQLRALIVAAHITWPFDQYALLLILARTGMRIGEAVGLQWGDLNLDGRVAQVRRTCRGARVSTPKSGKARTVQLSAQLVDVLRELHRQRRVVALDDARRGREWLFPEQRFGRGDRPMQYRRFYDLFVPLARTLGLRDITPHALRHTYASLCLAAGKELHFVQQQLGHASPGFTLTIYGHLVPRDRRGEVDFLDDLGAPVRSTPASAAPS
jgi:integrase